MALLEGFETYVANIPQDLSWTFNGTENPTTFGSSTSNVTQGSFSYRWQDTIGAGNFAQLQTTGVDLTSSNTVFVDVTIDSNTADGFAQLNVVGAGKGSNSSDATSAGTTGSFTLSVDISGFSGKNSITINLQMFGVAGGTYDTYWDNLRDDVAGVGRLLLGTTEINRISLGTTTVNKVFLGDVIVYDKTGP